MSLNLDVVIDSPDETVDMKSGLDTLQGVSDAARCIAETVLTGKVPERQNHKASVRTTLKQSFRGSYGQIFSIDTHDDKTEKKLRQIGRSAFVELIAYFLNESIYREQLFELSDKAQRVIADLGDSAEDLTKQLRLSPLKQLHEVSEKFGYGVKIRYRPSRVNQTELAQFDRDTAKSVYAKPARDDVRIFGAITRLNINTGNGRLQVEGGVETVAFGFSVNYARVVPNIRAKLSDNLSWNNTHHEDAWVYLEITARPVQLRDGKVVKYIIKGLVL
jgi:hypothetical protein